jgi:hypothetical protein
LWNSSETGTSIAQQDYSWFGEEAFFFLEENIHNLWTHCLGSYRDS